MSEIDYTLGLDEEAFKNAPEPGELPNGIYKMRLKAVEVLATKDGTRNMLKQELDVVDGPFESRKHFRNNLWDTEMSMGFFKKDLKGYGVDTHAPEFTLGDFLRNRLVELLDLDVMVKIGSYNDKNTGELKTTSSVIRLASDDDLSITAPETPDAVVQPADNPFAKK